MFELALGEAKTLPGTLLCLGAHCDDIEIGCGGTVLALTERFPDLHVHWVVLSSTEQRAAEAERAATRLLERAGDRRIAVEAFRDGYFPFDGAQLKDYFEALATRVNPDLIFTHSRHDRHQDHRTVSDLTWNTFRNHLVLEYEIPKYDGDLGQPNAYVPLTDAQRQAKAEVLLDCFESQAGRAWFERETFDGLMRLRGMECNAASGYAEAFHGRKLVIA